MKLYVNYSIHNPNKIENRGILIELQDIYITYCWDYHLNKLTTIDYGEDTVIDMDSIPSIFFDTHE